LPLLFKVTMSAIIEEDQHAPLYENTNGMPLHNGKTHHMECGFGDIANRVVTVGAVSRAEKIAAFFDKSTPTKTIHSHRGFTTITGKYNDVDVSIVAIGMGPSMMDFFVRETRAVVNGPMAMVRFGTCGGLTAEAPEGTIVVASGGSGYITRNPDAFAHTYGDSDDSGTNTDSATEQRPPSYNMYKVCPSDKAFSDLVQAELSVGVGAEHVVTGTNVTGESFYSSQGRIDGNFDDDNGHITDAIRAFYPNATTLEMETFILLHLAKCCKVSIKATAAAIVVANRPTGKVVDGDVLDRLEAHGGRAILEAVTKLVL